MKCHHPDVFCAALLNAQPMGFYAPAQVVRDAREHGVEVRPVCVNASEWDCTLEDTARPVHGGPHGPAHGQGPGAAHATAVIARAGGGYASVADVWRRAAVPVAALERLAEADAFAGMGADRRAALWAIRGLGEPPPPLLALCAAPVSAGGRGGTTASRSPPWRTAARWWRITSPPGLPCAATPSASCAASCAPAAWSPAPRSPPRGRGAGSTVPGIVLVRQKPGSAKGVMFITIEDETGIANLVLWPSLFEKQRRLVLSAGMIACRGRVQRDGTVIHVVVEHLVDLSQELRSVGNRAAVPDRARPRRRRHPPGQRRLARAGGRGGWRTRDIYSPDGQFTNGHIKVPTRDFR